MLLLLILMMWLLLKWPMSTASVGKGRLDWPCRICGRNEQTERVDAANRRLWRGRRLAWLDVAWATFLLLSLLIVALLLLNLLWLLLNSLLLLLLLFSLLGWKADRWRQRAR